MTKTFARRVLRLAAGCSFALLLAAGGAAFAHGGHNGGGHGGGDQHHSSHHDNWNRSGHNGQHASNHGGDWGGDHGWHHKHHHHHHHKSASNGPGGLGPVHGPGSSHNPIVAHPPKVPKPVVTVGPVKPPPPQHYVRHLRCDRDHRTTAWGTPISNVHDHRQKYGGGDFHRCFW